MAGRRLGADPYGPSHTHEETGRVTPVRAFLACAACLCLCASPAFADAAGGGASPGPEIPAGQAGRVGQVDPVEQAAAGEAAQQPQALEDAPDPLFDEDFDAEIGPQVSDPFESGNRAILRFNQALDHVLWSPLTKGYRFVVPEPARRSVRRALDNLNTPVYVVNHLLQLHPLAAAETLGAFVMNSTWGIGGLFDAASAVGLRRVPADFGQTLARAGVGAGPYLVIPVFGPSTVRDGFGWVVDRAFHPATYFLGVPVQLVWRGGVGVADRDAVADKLEALEESSLDFYSVLRSAYVQAREREIEGTGSDAADAVASSL
jgi:phospholipid-binding lipoprotein MlaA